MPQRVLPILDKTARLDMIDLYNNNLTAKAENIYGGQAEMLRKTDDFISIKCTESSNWQIRSWYNCRFFTISSKSSII